MIYKLQKGKIVAKIIKPITKNSSKGLNLESWPKASYKYNSKTGDFDVVAPLKDWVEEGEFLVPDYFDSSFEYNRLLESGASSDLANEIMAVRSINSTNRLPSTFRNLGKNTYGVAENKDGRPLIKYNARRKVKSSLVTPEITLNTIFHELGGHGSSLNIGSGYQVIPEVQKEILSKIYKHNTELKPVLRPVFQAIKDGDLETANSLASSLDDMYKDESGKLYIEEIQELIKYMEDVQEYSARAMASNMSDYYGLKSGWNEEQLRKFFTDESVDNLKKMVWGVGVPLTASVISSNELKKGGIVKDQSAWSKIPDSAKAKSYFSGLKDYLFHTTKSFIPSKFKPTLGNDINKQYYTRPGLKEEVALNLFGGTDKNVKNFLGDRNYFYKDFDDAYNQIINTSNKLVPRTASNGTLGNYTISAGNDENGRYISFIDKFDHVMIPGKDIPIYDRLYENEINDLYNSKRSALSEGDWITKSPILKKLKK